MDYGEINKAHNDALTEMSEEVLRLWRECSVEAARLLGDQFWSELPEPKHSWDWLSQVPMFIAERALAQGCLMDARKWLERAQLWARQGVSDQLLSAIGLIEGMILFEEGHLDRAEQHFRASYNFLGRLQFQRHPQKYWDFFAERAGLLHTNAAPEADLDSLAAEGEERFDRGDLDAAANSLISGHMLDGEEIWEDEHPKYRQLLVDRGLLDSI